MKVSLPDQTMCSQLSSSVDEQLFGTAPKTEVWLMIEYDRAPGVKALEESEIPQLVKSYLEEKRKTIQNSRVLLLRRDLPRDNSKIYFYFGIASQTEPVLYEFYLNGYEDLLNIDFSSLLLREASVSNHKRNDPLFLVCTNGKRDPCCALWGPAVYEEASRYASGSVWQTSHVGGHRFAANVISLPHGIYFGRVRSSHAKRLLENYQKQILTLENYRGRACFTKMAQAAEYYLRRETGILHVNALRLIDETQSDVNRWQIRFYSNFEEAIYVVNITSNESAFEIFESCSNQEKLTRPTQYQLDDWSKT